jgi:DNA-binding MarR family transcriptional regulator
MPLRTAGPSRQWCEKKPWREASDVYEWRDAIRSERGPPSPTTRLVLICLSLWINRNERQCWPSQKTLARHTGLSLRTVKQHLALADDEGWIFRERKRRTGRRWAQTFYEMTIPVGAD